MDPHEASILAHQARIAASLPRCACGAILSCAMEELGRCGACGEKRRIQRRRGDSAARKALDPVTADRLDTIQRLEAEIKGGKGLRQACAELGISHGLPHWWAASHPVLRRAWDRVPRRPRGHDPARYTQVTAERLARHPRTFTEACRDNGYDPSVTRRVCLQGLHEDFARVIRARWPELRLGPPTPGPQRP